MLNKKYTRTKKNEGIIPLITDQRTRYVPRRCGNCMECRKQKAREWQIRLLEDIKNNKTGKFITLTFSTEAIIKIIKGIKIDLYKSLKNKTKTGWRKQIPKGYDLDNAIATYGIRHFLERYRKEHKKSLRHWLVTELGHKISLPVYWRNKIYTEEEREKLWINRLDKEERWILGTRIDVSQGQEEYEKGLIEARKLNAQLGYGTSSEKEMTKKYEEQRRQIMLETRIKNSQANRLSQ